MSLNTPSYPISFPLGLCALSLGSLDWACLKVELTSSFERRIAQHTLTHAPSTGAVQQKLTGSTLGICNQPAHEAGLSTDV